MDRDYDNWARNGATGWAFKDVLPMYKSQEDWEGGANEWRGAGGPIHIRRPGTPHPTAPAFLEAAKQMGFAMLDDVNGPLRAGAGYIKHEHCRRWIARELGARISAAESRSTQPHACCSTPARRGSSSKATAPSACRS